MSFAKGGWLIPLSLLVAMVLAIARLPGELPQWVDGLRPAWALALLFYCNETVNAVCVIIILLQNCQLSIHIRDALLIHSSRGSIMIWQRIEC